MKTSWGWIQAGGARWTLFIPVGQFNWQQMLSTRDTTTCLSNRNRELSQGGEGAFILTSWPPDVVRFPVFKPFITPVETRRLGVGLKGLCGSCRPSQEGVRGGYKVALTGPARGRGGALTSGGP